jgi:hypothetical protein
VAAVAAFDLAWPHLLTTGLWALRLWCTLNILLTFAHVGLCAGVFFAPDPTMSCLESCLAAVGYEGSTRAFIYSWVFPSPHMGECMWASMNPEVGDHWEHMVYTPTLDPRSFDMPLPCSSSLCLQARFVPIESQFSDVLWQAFLATLAAASLCCLGLVLLGVLAWGLYQNRDRLTNANLIGAYFSYLLLSTLARILRGF